MPMRWMVVVPGLLLAATGSGAQTGPGPAEPRLSVLLETDALVANDEHRVELWVANPSDSALAPLRLHWLAPAFVSLGTVRDGACEPATAPMDLGRLAPRSILSERLCLQVGGEVVEGDYDLAFTLAYGRDGEAPEPRLTGYVQAEQRIRVGLFGTDSVGGVSLRLASFIVPGLLFFFVLQFGRIRIPTDALRLATLSVFGSVLLSLAVGWVAPPARTGGTSVGRFIVLCTVGVALAALVVVGRWRLEARRRGRLVDPVDDEAATLRKALARRTGRPEPVSVTLTNGEILVGSTAAPTTDGGTALLGWFEVAPAEEQASELRALAEAGDWLRLLKRTTAAGLPLRLLNPIRRQDGARLIDLEGAPGLKRIGADDVESVVVGPVPGVAQPGPVVVR